MNKKAIGGIVLAAILVAGMLTLMPSASADLTALDKIGTIINILLNIQEDLSDKLKLIVGKDDVSTGFSGGEVEITVNATNAEGELVPFNLKEVYACGTITTEEAEAGSGAIFVRNVKVEGDDILIRDTSGGDFSGEGTTIVFAELPAEDSLSSCADILTLLADIGRAGSVGLGSDTDVVIVLDDSTDGDASSRLDLVKCIAFVPQEAEILTCDAELEVPM